MNEGKSLKAVLPLAKVQKQTWFDHPSPGGSNFPLFSVTAIIFPFSGDWYLNPMACGNLFFRVAKARDLSSSVGNATTSSESGLLTST